MRFFPWASVVPGLALSLMTQGAIAVVLMRHVRARIEVLRILASDVSILHAGIELITQLRFRSVKLNNIAASLSAQDAGKAVRALERLLTALDRREDPILYGISIWFAGGTQLVLATNGGGMYIKWDSSNGSSRGASSRL
jgi:hypothetical protein